jgi:hypothetical protein
MRKMTTLALALGLMAVSAGPLAGPALAQGAMGGPGGRMSSDMFNGMSAEGRQIMSQAMMAGRDGTARDQLKAAHDQVMTLLSQPTVDRAALQKAMAAEDKIMIDQINRQSDSMLKGFMLLSAADRQAWVANERAMRARMQGRRKGDGQP